MATTAYVLIDAAADKTKNVLGKLSKVKGVKSFHAVTGPYDIIVVVEAEDVKALGEVVLSKIRTIDGVAKTMTCVAVEA
ncbi:MAG: Lrp/AsnC ligand binding domain-containing protein [candidate division NC10 bacterium]|nr:Lrp/AsnC ligand binding domain-containing protein [candidate division NC10 bacterium]